jgi:glycosyltransferase involved in cell wall biosynthesis
MAWAPSDRAKPYFNSIDPRPGHPWFAEGGLPVILGVGELGYRKDFTTLIHAFAQVREQRPCRLVILGRGRQREELQALARDLGEIGRAHV